MPVLLSSAYLAPVEYYRLLAGRRVFIETADHYVKQTYRNRCRIATANGVQTLSIPVEKSCQCPMRDVRIADHGEWQHLHWQALVSAYNSSPFFEYYADDFRPFYERKMRFLLDFNTQLQSLVCRLLGIAPDITFSDTYEHPADVWDLRDAIHPKKAPISGVVQPYYQVFGQKYGFQAHLSVVDLLFNMGPEGLFVLVG
jgi:hypothetical protein